MARVAVLAARDTVAQGLLHALGGSAERVAHDSAQIDAVAIAPFDTLVYAPSLDDPPGADVAVARAICERLASVPLKQIVLVSSAAVYTADHEHVGLLDE